MDEHIYHDNVDRELEDALKEKHKPKCIIYASRHRSESGKRSLTVHPIGNFGDAEFGGQPKTLVPASPHLMTQAIRVLKNKAKSMDYAVSFEATHHGPYLQTPAFFIEIGSEEEAWKDESAGRVIAETILETQKVDYPVGIGVGGGHYAPRITDVALEREISFGHIVPTYALNYLTQEMADQVVARTNDAEKIYFHKKKMKAGQHTKWKEIFLGLGMEPVRSIDLNQLRGESH
jgi:D-aminoacyl-tRNA deacylase